MSKGEDHYPYSIKTLCVIGDGAKKIQRIAPWEMKLQADQKGEEGEVYVKNIGGLKYTAIAMVKCSFKMIVISMIPPRDNRT